MKAVIVGCGRVGAATGRRADRAGWQVLIIDLDSAAFDRLPSGVRRDRRCAATAPTRTSCAGPAPRTPTCSSP